MRQTSSMNLKGLCFSISLVLSAGAAHAGNLTADDTFKQFTPEAVNKLREAKIDINALLANNSNDFIIQYKEDAFPLVNNAASGNLATDTYKNVKQATLGQLSNQTVVMRDYYGAPTNFLRVSSREDLVKLLNNPNVVKVMPNIKLSSSLKETLPYIHQPEAVARQFQDSNGQSNNFTGEGSVVAVFDTGLDPLRPGFGDCRNALNQGSCRVVDIIEFAPDDNGYTDGQDDDGSLHGSNVSGIVAGVAPKAKVVSLDVFGWGWGRDPKTGERKRVHTAPSDATFAAFNWVRNNHISKNPNGLNIVANNLSLGGNGPIDRETNEMPIITTLKNMGVATVIAAGNEELTTGVAWPAAEKDAIAVGATYDQTLTGYYLNCNHGRQYIQKDQVTCFSNSGSLVDLLAPGYDVTAAGLTMTGTSQATPHVAGAIAILRQPSLLKANNNESVDATLNRLKTTGVAVRDYRNGITRPRIDLLAAVNSFRGVNNIVDDNDSEPATTPTPAQPVPAPTTQPKPQPTTKPVVDSPYYRYLRGLMG